MKKIREYKFLAIAMLVLAVVIALPPLLHKETCLIINNDTAVHLATFEALKSGEASFLYLGQAITGYALVGIEKVIGISIQTSFMWFNFLALFLSGLAVATIVMMVTKSKLASTLSAFIITFGVGSTMHLFLSGTIFNIIEMLILLPVLIILVYKMFQGKNIKWLYAIIPLAIFMFFFHPSLGQGISFLANEVPAPVPTPVPNPGEVTNSSILPIPITPTPYFEAIINPIALLAIFFGISNLAVLVLCWIAFHARTNREKVGMGIKTTLGTLLALSILLTILTFTGATPFSSRMAINLCLVLGLLLCLFVGIALKYNQSRLAKTSVISLVIVGMMPNLVNWFTWTSFYNPERGAY